MPADVDGGVTTVTLALQRRARATQLLFRLQVSSSVLRQLWGTADSSGSFSTAISAFRGNTAAVLMQIKVQSLNGDQSHFSTESKPILFNCSSSKSTRQVISLRDNGGIKPEAAWWRASLNIVTGVNVKRLTGEQWVTAVAWTHVSGDFKNMMKDHLDQFSLAIQALTAGKKGGKGGE